MTEMLLNGMNAPNLPSIQIGLSRLSEMIRVNLFWVHPSKPKFEPSSPNSQLATRDSQLATCNSQLATCNSQLALYLVPFISHIHINHIFQKLRKMWSVCGHFRFYVTIIVQSILSIEQHSLFDTRNNDKSN